MNRPYIFCHMLTSLDGKIMGNYMDLPQCEAAGDLFYDLAFGEAPSTAIRGGCQAGSPPTTTSPSTARLT